MSAWIAQDAGHHPHHQELRDLVGELSTVSEEFRTRWATHDVRLHDAGSKEFNHPDFGCVNLGYQTMDVSAHRDRSLALTVYSAEPGSPSEDQLRLPASWAAIHPLASAEEFVHITRSSLDTVKGPGDWSTGDVYIDGVAAPPPSRVTANLMHFTPGARTHWPLHPLSQTVFVSEGVGLCQPTRPRVPQLMGT